jgi:hypothetical protein
LIKLILLSLVCHEPLDEAEKSFIIQWVEANQIAPTATIHWKDLISAMKDRFGKLRSENKIKNFWYPKQRSLKQEIRQDVDYKHGVDDNKNDITSLPLPFESHLLISMLGFY